MPRQVSNFLRNQPWTEYPVLLFFGYADDIIHQHCAKILQNTGIDRQDAFQYLRLYGSELQNDPKRLIHEASSSSLTMQERWIVVQGKTEELEPALKVLCAPDMETRFGSNHLLIVVEDLSAKAAILRKCGDCPWVAAIPCYETDGKTLHEHIAAFCCEQGWNCSPEAKDLLLDYAGHNLDNVLHLLGKIVLHGIENQQLDARTVMACHDGGDDQQNLQDFTLAAFSGHASKTDALLRGLLEQKTSAIVLIRTLSQHNQKLLRLQNLARETSLEQAMKHHHPPIFFKQIPEIRQQCQRWSHWQLQDVLQQLLNQEILAKSTRFHDLVLLRQLILRITKTV
ncbi:MAG: DNA polymerase III subunit delta [Alphaproteobacteria bacterium]|nr:DNA polymerase III subunit delta [Alphaproteobacteria bacterium]